MDHQMVRPFNQLSGRALVPHLTARLPAALLTQASRPHVWITRRRQTGVLRVLQNVREVRFTGQPRLLAGFCELFAEIFDCLVKLMNLSDPA
jgi:hypothetical protein